MDPANPHIDPCLDILLSNIAQSKIQALHNFKAQFAGMARKIATDTGIQGSNPALSINGIRVEQFGLTRG